MRDLRSGLEFLGIAILPIVLVIGGIVILAYYSDHKMCAEKTQIMNIESRWGFWSGCMLNVGGQWLPWSSVVPVERNGKIVFVPRPHVLMKADK